MTEEKATLDVKDVLIENDYKISIKENDTYINIPKEILEKRIDLLTDYIRICSSIENLKSNINNYLFDNNTNISLDVIQKELIKIKSEEKLNGVMSYIKTDINKIEEKLTKLCACFNIQVTEINTIKQELIKNHINDSYNIENIIEKEYVKEVIENVKNGNMYSLREKSRYGTVSDQYNLKNKNDIADFNNEEINGTYSPILVIHRPAKYHRGTYILEDTSYVYIKRQPLEALIKQERLEEKGIDSMGAITYKKLKSDLTNENLQEILAELYVYGQQNNIKFENIKLADITSNKVWMTADKLKKEFKELRYYHKNLTQKVKEIYDTTGKYYTQIGGKYIFNTREFLTCYKAYKEKDING